MQIIADATALACALDSSLDPAIKSLLALRRDQLLADTGGDYDIGELAHWIIVQAGDTLAAVEVALGFPIAPDPPWEYVIVREGVLEAPTITSDSGFGIVLIVPNNNSVDHTLLDLLRRDATAATEND